MMYFFDLDGTLLDSNGIWLEIDIAFLGARGIAPVPEDYTDYVANHSAFDAARYTQERFRIPDTPEQILAAWSQMAQEAYASMLALKPGAARFLHQCASRGIPMAILTSCMPHLCRAALEHHGLTALFQAVLTTAETGLEKRDPALYQLAARTFSLSPAQCTLFEDSPSYCAAALQAGFQIVGVRDHLFAPREEELRALCGPGRFVTDWEIYHTSDI